MAPRLLIPVAVLALAGSGGCFGPDYTDINSAVLASENVERRLEKINGRYIVGASDSIQVIVRGHAGLSGSHRIAPDGNITMQLIGDIYVEGMTGMQIADVLTEALRVYVRDVDVLVRVTGFNSKHYYMFGETSVGEKPFDGDVTILKAFGRAGGVSNRAAWDRIRVIRATLTTRQIFKVNLAEIIKEGDWSTNIQVKANDVIYVPPTYFARLGYLIDNILFPFRTIFGTVRTVTGFGAMGGE
jgi:polysaccharide export outer membrane protein